MTIRKRVIMFMSSALDPLLCLLALTTGTQGYPYFADRIPNGDNVPHPCKPNYIWHGVGHENALGGGIRNQFGKDFFKSGSKWTQALCQKDSDGDGLTNGQELGDPDCVWTSGALPARTSSITHPGVCDPWDDPNCREINTWVSCDLESFHCDALQNDPDVKNVTFRFPPTAVPNTETNYFCMTFDLPGDDTYHLVATEPYIDNANVMHHILVYGCEGDDPLTLNEPTKCKMEATGCLNLIGLWQVGSSGVCINPNTGFIFGKGEFTRIRMEFHWNNPELRSDYTDSSGMRFFYTPNLRPHSASTMMIGQMDLEIPPRQPSVNITGSCSSQCTSDIITQPMYVIEGVNHMHYLGKSQRVELFRKGTLVAQLTYDEVYNYDAPVIHLLNPPVQLLPGDEIRTTCEYSSKNKDTVTKYGTATSAEMCFAFLTVYPREGLKTRQCIANRERSMCYYKEKCDFSHFLNYGVPEIRQFMVNVGTKCQPFGPCTPQCARVMETMKDEPCMKSENLEQIESHMMTSEHSMQFLAQLMACWPPHSCPKCACGLKDSGRPADSQCDPSRFLNTSVPQTQQFLDDLSIHCNPFGPCSQACVLVMYPLKSHPCLQPAAFPKMKQAMMTSLESMVLLSRLIACRYVYLEPCPECRECNGDAGDANGLVSPGMVGVIALLTASFFFN